MKNLFPIFILLFAGSLFAQTPISVHHGCNFDGDEKETEYYSFDPSNEASKIVRQILDAAGSLSYNSFILKESNVENAIATAYNNERFILYSTVFLEKFKGDANTKWAAYTVLAHEIGHHLNNHNFAEQDPRKRKSMELEADKFAGAVCRTLGATLAEALAGIESMKLEGETATHPAKSARKAAVANGWKRQDETLQNSQVVLDSAAGNSKTANPAVVDSKIPANKPVVLAADACPKCSGEGTIVNKIKCRICDADGWVWIKETCKICNGTDRAPGLKCLTCGGSGKKTITERCATCKGSGQLLGLKCTYCDGYGRPGGTLEACKTCKGTGHMLSGTCAICTGKGTADKVINCETCSATGLQQCPDINCVNGIVKTGKKTCETCNGVGRIDDRDRCKTCKGTGKKKKP